MDKSKGISKPTLIGSMTLLTCLGLTASACHDVPETQRRSNFSVPVAPPVDAGMPSGPDADGLVTVMLHPNHESAIGAPMVAAFGAPFPRGVLSSVERLVVLDAEGRELRSHVEELVTWRTLGGSRDSDGSVRAALVYVPVELADHEPLEIQLAYGAERTRELGPQEAPPAGWVAIEDDDFDDPLPEPPVYAVFPPEWLGQAELRTVTTPVGADEDWSWFDEFFVGAAHTATNDVPEHVWERIDVEDNEPWLFDRTATLFGVYARTGDVRWLRHAHRSARFYLSHLTDEGFFEYKDRDLKYVYGQSLLCDMILTGDRTLIEPIERAAELQREWEPHYTLTTGFWTERHQTYALLGALAAWEATGDPEHGERAREIASASFAHASDPPGDWPRDGCMLHTMSAHEGIQLNAPICSPWMSGLFADAVWRYYRHSMDRDALVFLANLGDFLATHGLYDGSGEGVPFEVPWYLVSSIHRYSASGASDDLEHTCDVANAIARGAWARDQLGEDPTALIDTTLALLAGCRYDLELWHLPDEVSSGQPEWRLLPSRKFNWWFGTTSDMPWILSSLGASPADAE